MGWKPRVDRSPKEKSQIPLVGNLALNWCNILISCFDLRQESLRTYAVIKEQL
jgi:hypothetical protein